MPMTDAHQTLAAVLTSAFVVLGTLACQEKGVEPDPSPGSPTITPVPTTVAVSPATGTLVALGETVQLSAQVLDQGGTAMTGVALTWSSGNAAVATVNAAGRVTAVSNGSATITATAGGASGRATLTVAQSTVSMTVSPAAVAVGPGDTLRLSAEARDPNGHVVGGASFMWSSGNAAVATVDASGLVRGAGEGTARITAASGGNSATSEVTVTNPDRAALVALYEATNGPNWVDNTNWLTNAPLGEWYGVDTDMWGRVVRLNLAGRVEGEIIRHGLEGEVPIELGELAKLRTLNLGFNQLTGGIPRGLGGLGSLDSLFLHHNELTGGIPPWLGDLGSLEYLTLRSNELTGGIPPELGNLGSLEALSVRYNQLTGGIPVELGRLANLRGLYLGGNQLRGVIPPWLGGLANLQDLWLHDNELTGGIPGELGRLANLRSLALYDNQLTGGIPSEFGNLDSLLYLDLEINQLTGGIPPEFGNLDSLEHLLLSNNPLSGALPLGLANLPIRTLWYHGTRVCVPRNQAFRAWLEGIPNHSGTGILCSAAGISVRPPFPDPRNGDNAHRIKLKGALMEGLHERWESSGTVGRNR